LKSSAAFFFGLDSPRDLAEATTRAGIEDRINLQRDGSHAKPYQVKQVRAVVLKYHLAEN
jgi:hypothetical protein